MGLDLKYLKGAFGPEFSEQKPSESLKFRLAPSWVLPLTQSRNHPQESPGGSSLKLFSTMFIPLGQNGGINTPYQHLDKSLCVL